MEKQINSPRPREITLRLRLSRKLIVAIGLSLLVVGTVLLLKLGGNAYDNIFSQDMIKQAGFPLYSPAKLPKGLTASADSVRSSEGVVTFSINDNKGNFLAASEQAVPPKFDFAKFYKDNVELPQQSSIPQGKLTTGKFNGLPVCMLVTAKTWIIVNDPSGSHQDQLVTVCRGLQPAN